MCLRRQTWGQALTLCSAVPGASFPFPISMVVGHPHLCVALDSSPAPKTGFELENPKFENPEIRNCNSSPPGAKLQLKEGSVGSFRRQFRQCSKRQSRRRFRRQFGRTLDVIWTQVKGNSKQVRGQFEGTCRRPRPTMNALAPGRYS